VIACVPGLGDILGFALLVPLLVGLVIVVAAACKDVWRDW
jgi:hypothetical protein